MPWTSVLIGISLLVGPVSWDVNDGDIAEFQGGLYGMEAALVRLSYYQEWITETMGRDHGMPLPARPDNRDTLGPC